ncbi:phosphoribosyl-AMP cyclohydrolase [Mangrovimicrobium sediminis]|uniref:Phosphoribosyl-AMP cyclohydrolase n=1 Tax=Mangrovimicrobium sediminis TaxID=2562682 RepID=A0A4Z0M0T9_9GAMM|nr:phosphoribosyl-AMP cyclohydrolase [Haliea sp. SAOS-164]TGD73047.1 phosphoribosyl-AMP cyclohydrolase [Haliea sp. SAOS-164]
MNLNDAIKWNEQGLVAAIAQDWQSGEVLMQAWMNAESLAMTVREGKVVYWSRSRQALWRKGESSGNEQQLKELRVDCDGDCVLLKVEQRGGIACHTGRRSCFYRLAGESGELQVVDAVIRDPGEMYGK